MKKSLVVLSVGVMVGMIFLPIQGKAQMGPEMTGEGKPQPQMMGPGMMGPGMMGGSMMGQGMMPMMGMAGWGRMGLTGLLHQWGRNFFMYKDQLGLSEEQLDKIETSVNSYLKYFIRKNADRMVLLIEIRESLLKNNIDLGEVEKKVKAVEALNTDIEMEGIRTLAGALAVLTPEQQKKVKTLFKESTFPRAMRMGPGMMGGGMMPGSVMPGQSGEMGKP
ncbi:MAG: hypothetical protein JRG73_11945 [Deltaproteobacteria bacterium]|nr:hypothetical protein [Deltaproteobacteria bacterium]MBW2307633.1 hypothetical protein [Deltaproteobacteria bacterium]